MLRRLRSTWLAGGGAFLLVVSLSGIASGFALVTDTQTFVDVDGNGVADSCDAVVVANPVAAGDAFAAADTVGDGAISVTEAAHSGWIGGKNCNHGGYVSSIAKTAGDTCDTVTPPTAAGANEDSADGDSNEGKDAPATEVTTVSTVVAPTGTDCTTDPAEDATTTEGPPAVCPVVVFVPPVDGVAPVAPVDTAPNAHGKAVSEVAQSDAVGGKNCNHGGAVSAAAKKDHGADAAAKAAAKAAKHAKHAHGKGHKTQ
jgi:hypothetical protein